MFSANSSTPEKPQTGSRLLKPAPSQSTPTQTTQQTISDEFRLRIKQSFNQWDKDQNGFIDKDEIRSVLIAIAGGELPENIDQQVDAMIQSMDLDADGKVSFDEFLSSYVTKVSRIIRDDSAVIDDVRFSNQMHVKRDRTSEAVPGDDVEL